MHMADALLSPAVGGTLYAASVAAAAYSTKKIKTDDLGENKVPLMAVTGAMVFAAQMINITIPGTGSSGHLGGGILLAALLGPYAGMLTMSAVLVIQCLFFADGGLLALGCNIFNIAVIPCLFVYPLIMKKVMSPTPTKRRIWAGSMVSAIIALQLGSFCLVIETTASGIAELPFATFALLMQPIHLAIGVLEGVITAAILTFVFAARPQMLTGGLSPGKPAMPIKKVVLVFAVIAAVVAGGLSLLASENPDGLEWAVFHTAGVEELHAEGDVHDAFASAQESLTMMPDYELEEGGGAPIAGLVGAAIVFAAAGAAALVIRACKRKRKDAVKQAS